MSIIGPARRGQDHVLARTRAGDTAALRPLENGEQEPLLSVFDGMSLDSRADRYLVGLPRLPARMVAHLANVDGSRHVAWLATVADRPAGIARYLRVAPGTAELAFEVADAFQGRGLGTVLVDAVTTVACAQGIRRVRATALASNTPSRRLLARLGLLLVPGEGVLEGEGRLRLLHPPRVDRQAVLALARGQAGTDTLSGPCA